jgi:hypothetical protein
LARVIGVIVIVLASLVVVGKVQTYFGIKNLDVQSVTQELKTTRTQTALGNSAFTPPNAQSPLGYPEAAVTVLFRPFPWEAKSATVVVSSGEGLLLLGLVAVSWRRLRRLPHFLVRNPYVLFCFVYCALFILAFANFSNFGILARERVQMLPMVLALLALPNPGTDSDEVVEEVADADTPPARRLRSYDATRERRVGARAVVGPYRALDYCFDVEVTAGPFRSVVQRTLVDQSDAGPAEYHYQLIAAPGPDGLLAIVARDGRRISSPLSVFDALVHLVADVNVEAVASCPDKLMLHAGAVSVGGRGLLLPGHSGSGKSTLTAALVSHGCGYLTDEAAAINPAWLEIEPYPKPLSLQASSVALLRHEVVPSGARGMKQLVPSSALRPRAVARAVPPRLIVFPSYEVGATSTLTTMSRAEAMIELANNSFNFVDHGGDWMPLLRRLVTACWCGRLHIGDLDEATALLIQMARDLGGVTVP